MQPKKIVWMSRHSPTPSQLTELERLFPGYTLHIDPNPFSSAADIVARFKAAKGDEMLVVAPWTVIRELIKLGIRPIYAEMKAMPLDDPSVEVRLGTKRKRGYKFVRFHYCEDVALKLTPIPEPEAVCT